MKVDPDAAGLDARRLENITEHFQQRYLVPEKIAGCQVAVARHGAVGYFRNFGSMDLERGKPVDDGTIWRIYSMTKPITGVALMKLYEQGHFQLGDPVHRFIPEWRGLKVRETTADGETRIVDPKRPMSVKDLMMHMSGLGYGVERSAAEEGSTDILSLLSAGREGTTLEDFCARFSDRPLRFHPGTQWFYSVSTDICGRLVEIISGQRFDEFLQENIFDPLGMNDTGFTVPDDKIDRFAALYRRGADKKIKLADDPERSAYRKPKTFLSGGGGLVSTMEDYLRFAQMLTNGGELDGVRILGRKTVELMSLNHLPGGADLRQFALPGGYGEVGFDGMGFGLTVAVNLGPAASQSIGSAGDFSWGGAASTIFWCDPAEDLTVVFMTQLLPSGTFNFRNQLKSLVYSSIVD
ncbi:MAG TPA: serine hydrolase domain-containing protein [Acidimicrobiales bacterium]|jgi:CubicO group peptidase (beta-lactamase class C family)|nr:serine hydrolase domain-containing protein [Acidimicrobiales bacterium]